MLSFCVRFDGIRLCVRRESHAKNTIITLIGRAHWKLQWKFGWTKQNEHKKIIFRYVDKIHYITNRIHRKFDIHNLLDCSSTTLTSRLQANFFSRMFMYLQSASQSPVIVHVEWIDFDYKRKKENSLLITSAYQEIEKKWQRSIASKKKWWHWCWWCWWSKKAQQLTKTDCSRQSEKYLIS